MIHGFAFRDPGVIKMVLDRVKYAPTVIPPMSPTNKHVSTYREALQQPIGKRTRVFLVAKCATLCNLVTQVREFDHDNAIYCVFDSASTLFSKTCVEVLDAESTNQPVWMYAKTTPATINSRLKPGLSDDDLQCLGMHPENPEDRVLTDVKREGRASRAVYVPLRDLLREILEKPGLQKNRRQAAHLLALYMTGKLVKPSERVIEKRNITHVGIGNVASYKAKEFEHEAYDRLVRLGGKFGVNFSKYEARILPMKALPEFTVVIRALMLTERGMAVDKACSMTGANSGAVSLLMTNLTPPEPLRAFKWASNTMSFPLHAVTKITGAMQVVEYEDKTARQAAAERIRVREGSYTLTGLLRAAKLLSAKETFTNQKHVSSAVPSTNVPKFTLPGGYEYRVAAGENYFVRFGKRVALTGIE